MTNRIIVLTLVAFLSVGCQAAMYGKSSDFDRLEVGMDKNEMVRAIGQPIQKFVDGEKNEVQYVYQKMENTLDYHPRRYTVTLRDGKIVKWGQQAKSED